MTSRNVPAPALVAWVLACSTAFAAPNSQTSGPTLRAPRNALWLTFVDELQTLRKDAVKLDKSILAKLEEFAGQDEADIAEYEATYGKIRELKRIGDKMIDYGEICGRDTVVRAGVFQAKLIEMAKSRSEDAKITRHLTRLKTTLPKLVTAADRRMSSLPRLAERKQHLQALQGFYKATDPVYLRSFWWKAVNGDHRNMSSWKTLHGNYYRAAKDVWQTESVALCKEEINKATPDYAGLMIQLQEVTKSVEKSGTAAIGDGQPMPGPQLLTMLVDKWIDAQRNALRARSFAAMLNRIESVFTHLRPLEDAHRNFTAQFSAGLVNLVRADAGRVSPEEAGPLYVGYLPPIARLLARWQGRSLRREFEQVLTVLADRSPRLQADIAAYRLATDDVLRWRQRTVAAYLRQRKEGFVDLEQRIAEATFPVGSRVGFFVNMQNRGAVARIRNPYSAPVVIEDVKKTFLDKPTLVSDLVTSQRRGSMGISRQKSVALVYVPVPMDVMKPLAASLESDLLGQPLTLDAQLALTRAKNGDLQMAAGTVNHIGLVGLCTRYTTLHEDDRGLIRLGQFDEHGDKLKFEDVFVLLLIQPNWLAHRYIFVEMPAGDGGT